MRWWAGMGSLRNKVRARPSASVESFVLARRSIETSHASPGTCEARTSVSRIRHIRRDGIGIAVAELLGIELPAVVGVMTFLREGDLAHCAGNQRRPNDGENNFTHGCLLFDFFGDVGLGGRFGIVETDQNLSTKSERSEQQRYRPHSFSQAYI